MEDFARSVEQRHSEMSDNGKDIGKNVSSSYRCAATHSLTLLVAAVSRGCSGDGAATAASGNRRKRSPMRTAVLYEVRQTRLTWVARAGR